MIFPIGELAALGAAFIWANTAVLWTQAGRDATPVATNTFKTLQASLIFALVLFLRDGVPYGRGMAAGDVVALALSGVLGLTVGDSLLFLGYQVIGPRRSLLLHALNPAMGAVGGWLFLSERLDGISILGMVIAMSGVAMVVSEKGDALPDGRPRRVGLGVALGLGAALGQASGALLAKAALMRVDTLAATQVRVGAALLALLILAVAGGRLFRWARLLTAPPVLWRVSLASLFGPFLGVWLMSVALDRTHTGVALTLMSTTPLWLLPVGALFMNDRPSPRETVGAFVAIAGVAILLLH
jgi:drug/metabolite transporter (DMT)-like permease